MINCVKFHKTLPLFGSSSGQRKFKYDEEFDDNQENDIPNISLWRMNYDEIIESSSTNETQGSITEEILTEIEE